jgi:hypothetical protein
MHRVIPWLLLGVGALLGTVLFYVAIWAAYILFLACGLE